MPEERLQISCEAGLSDAEERVGKDGNIQGSLPYPPYPNYYWVVMR
jgi:hypothetical protein